MNKYKNIALFLVKFFATYFLLFALYAIYLKSSQVKDSVFQCSSITNKVADQTVSVLSFFGYNVSSVQHTAEMSVKLLVEGHYIARVIEGCNSISIIILFVAFIVAFSGPKRTTIIYAIVGSLIIYAINILRIAFLTIMLYKYPNQQLVLHNLVFPAIIYGTTFLLWVIWVQKFSHHKK
ncbi:exosortase family protein XrtF [Polaribacter uvawellassae]|uniref:exosortase family protein XrtF n=1 Tax=Polaribacter uvawellassae TaxID=3133495 RepID=UPI00321AAD0A